MKFFKIILILFGFCFSTLFADYSWKKVNLESSGDGERIESTVNRHGAYVVKYIDSNEMDVEIYNTDGTSLSSRSLDISYNTEIQDFTICSNDDHTWVFWVFKLGSNYYLDVSRHNGTSWTDFSYTSLGSGSVGNLAMHSYATEYAARVVYTMDSGQVHYHKYGDPDGGSSGLHWDITDDTDVAAPLTSVGYQDGTDITSIRNESASKDEQIFSSHTYSPSADYTKIFFKSDDVSLQSLGYLTDFSNTQSLQMKVVSITDDDYLGNDAAFFLSIEYNDDDEDFNLVQESKQFGTELVTDLTYTIDGNMKWREEKSSFSVAEDRDLFMGLNGQDRRIAWISWDDHNGVKLSFAVNGAIVMSSFHTTITTEIADYGRLSVDGDLYFVYQDSSDTSIDFYYFDRAPIAPSIVKNWSGLNPKVTWAKPCFDTEEYKVYRKIDSGSFTLIATTSNLYYVENNYYFYRRGSHTLRYKVKAVDYDNNPSAYSNEVYYSHMQESSKIVGEFRPTEYALYNAYPNPFNPVTTITFDIPENGYASLSVYNSIGQKVFDLVEGNVEVGRHQVQVDGSNLSSGIYFVRMTAATFNKMQKIVLMK